MYGMVNQAVRELVLNNHGQEVWDKIRSEANVIETEFHSLHIYPDEMTYRLVMAASKVLDTPPEVILVSFGETWTDFASRTSFSRLIRFGGRTFLEFVQNLDQMHTKIKITLPELVPPSFRTSDVTDEGMRLHYYSYRPGLAPFVQGILIGLAKIYAIKIDIRLDKSRADGHDHDEFIIRYITDKEAGTPA